jgi:hypothetical protein
MRKNLYLLLVVGGFALSGLDGRAIEYRDFDLLAQYMDSTHSILKGSFNLVKGDGDLLDSPGFNPATQKIISATATFSFFDDSLFDSSETVKINLGGSVFLGETEVDMISLFGGNVTGIALINDLNLDGILEYTIKWLSGDFYAGSADLRVVAAPIGSVPDNGSTLSLLGVACLGLGWAGRKIKSL